MPVKKPTTPPIVQVGGSAGSGSSSSNHSTVTYQTLKPAENLYQALGKTEETIQELSRLFSECEDSGHYGVGGKLKLTAKQQELKKQIDIAQARADKLMEFIALLPKG